MENPIKRIREEKGLSRDEFAILCNVSYSVIASLESSRAVKVNKEVLEVLGGWGYDSEKIQEEYKEYRQELRQNLKVKKAEDDGKSD